MEDECSICLEPLNNNIAVLSCGHLNHYKCVKDWLNTLNKMNKLCVICEKDTEIISIMNESPTINKKIRNDDEYEYKSPIFCCTII